MKKYKVFIDDNYHYMDESHRYKLGKFDTLEEAIEACKKVVDEYLNDAYQPGMTSDELLTSYVLYGEDPFIVGAEKKVPFSARDYARERIKEICNDS